MGHSFQPRLLPQTSYRYVGRFVHTPTHLSFTQVLLISFSFIVSIILLNLLIAVMSDTYVVVKQRAKSEWMLLKARLILEIDSNMPDKFFSDPVR